MHVYIIWDAITQNRTWNEEIGIKIFPLKILIDSF